MRRLLGVHAVVLECLLMRDYTAHLETDLSILLYFLEQDLLALYLANFGWFLNFHMTFHNFWHKNKIK
jgi:hypothetical protein